MNVLGQVGSLISQGVYSVATPFHPFGGAVDVIVVEQEDGTYRSTPWYVRFGKFQGVLKGAEKIVGISVNGVEASFHMFLDNSGEAYFVREVVHNDDDIGSNNQNDNSISGSDQIFDEDVDNERQLYEFDDEQSYHYESLDRVEDLVESKVTAEMVLVSVDGHVLTAPISSAEENTDDVQLSTPQFHLGPGEDAEVTIGQLQDSAEFGGTRYSSNACENAIELGDRARSIENEGGSFEIHSSSDNIDTSMARKEIFKSCLELSELASDIVEEDSQGRVSPLVGVEMTTVIKGSKENSPSSLAVVEETEAENCTFESGDDGSGSLKIEVNKKVSYMGSDIVSAHSLNNDTEEKDEQLGVAPDSQGIECSTGRPANEEECSIPEKSESQMPVSSGGIESRAGMGFEISLCGDLLHAGMGVSSAREAFEAHRISEEEFQVSRASIVKNEKLIVRYKDRYLWWDKAAPIVLGMAAFGLDFSVELDDAISVEQVETPKATKDDTPGISSSPSGRRWRLWPIPFRRVKTLQRNSSNSSSEEVFVDTESSLHSPRTESISTRNGDNGSPHKQFRRTNTPTMEEIASLNLKDGQNMITFSFSTRVLGKQQVDAHVYLWKWNAHIVISDVDGTITRSDVLGQFMPLVGKDWTQSGVARLFSAIKENGYQLLFLSARAIVQAYLTRSFLVNLKQDGKALPNGPVVISPDGLFPSLYREVIRRAPHEFKIACLEDIRQLFPSDYNPFYAGFGNRDTDELTYRKMGIPKGKIFIINPKGEVAINNCIDVKSYTSLHTLVNDMFPPTSLAEQEDFNSWNYWKLPPLNID